MKFCVGNHATRQPLYICIKVDKLYFSRKACTETKILSEAFPYPMDWYQTMVASIRGEINIANKSIDPSLASCPDKIHFAPIP